MDGASIRACMLFDVNRLCLIEAFVRRLTTDTFKIYAQSLADAEERERLLIYCQNLKLLADDNPDQFRQVVGAFREDNEGAAMIAMALNMLALQAQKEVERFITKNNAMN